MRKIGLFKFNQENDINIHSLRSFDKIWYPGKIIKVEAPQRDDEVIRGVFLQEANNFINEYLFKLRNPPAPPKPIRVKKPEYIIKANLLSKTRKKASSLRSQVMKNNQNDRIIETEIELNNYLKQKQQQAISETTKFLTN